MNPPSDTAPALAVASLPGRVGLASVVHGRERPPNTATRGTEEDGDFFMSNAAARGVLGKE